MSDPEKYVVARKAQPVGEMSGHADRAIAGESTNHLDRKRGWEAESRMRVASLESVLAAASLIMGIVIVLSGIKIFYGV